MAYRRWYERVFLALFELTLIEKNRKKPNLGSGDYYVQLYPQSANCAILYSPASKYAKKGPLHLNPKRTSWDEERFQRIKPFIEPAEPDPKPDPNDFYFYHVKDWVGFATAMKLELF